MTHLYIYKPDLNVTDYYFIQHKEDLWGGNMSAAKPADEDANIKKTNLILMGDQIRENSFAIEQKNQIDFQKNFSIILPILQGWKKLWNNDSVFNQRVLEVRFPVSKQRRRTPKKSHGA